MTEITALDIARRTVLQPVEPRQQIAVRPATMDDYEFIDALQKKHSKMVGFLHRKSIETYIERGDVLIAEEGSELWAVGYQQENQAQSPEHKAHSAAKPLGYIISRDTYYKREDTGIVYQINVVPDVQRGLIAATLLKEVFARSPYGVKLYCCWCAQDLDANHFWEAMGFTPLAFRTGSATRGKKTSGGGAERMHIFWQRRIRSEDNATPWWFPSETKGGAIGEGRLVIPIPIGAHWSDPMPVLLPGEPERVPADRQIEGKAGEQESEDAKPKRRRAKHAKQVTAEQKEKSNDGGLWFAPTPEQIAAQAEAQQRAVTESKQKQKPKRVKQKNNPKYVAAARELRDRFLEEIERSPELLEAQSTGGKYDVCRQLEAAPSAMGEECSLRQRPAGLLDAA